MTQVMSRSAVFENGTVPTHHPAPGRPRRRSGALAVLVSAVLALTAVMVAERIEQSVTTPDDAGLVARWRLPDGRECFGADDHG